MGTDGVALAVDKRDPGLDAAGGGNLFDHVAAVQDGLETDGVTWVESSFVEIYVYMTLLLRFTVIFIEPAADAQRTGFEEFSVLIPGNGRNSLPIVAG